MGATSKPKPSTDKQHVSIHAPVWVRPRNPFVCRLIFRVSIHAPVWVRLCTPILHKPLKWFQFTHPCGCDMSTRPSSSSSSSFNSRTRVGATWAALDFAAGRDVSIHAPVWVRPLTTTIERNKTMFQFTHPCGCDPRTIKQ